MAEEFGSRVRHMETCLGGRIWRKGVGGRPGGRVRRKVVIPAGPRSGVSVVTPLSINPEPPRFKLLTAVGKLTCAGLKSYYIQ